VTGITNAVAAASDGFVYCAVLTPARWTAGAITATASWALEAPLVLTDKVATTRPRRLTSISNAVSVTANSQQAIAPFFQRAAWTAGGTTHTASWATGPRVAAMGRAAAMTRPSRTGITDAISVIQ